MPCNLTVQYPHVPPVLYRVAVLDGGLPAWKAVGGEVDSNPAKEEAMMAATKAAREVQAPNAGGH